MHTVGIVIHSCQAVDQSVQQLLQLEFELSELHICSVYIEDTDRLNEVLKKVLDRMDEEILKQSLNQEECQINLVISPNIAQFESGSIIKKIMDACPELYAVLVFLHTQKAWIRGGRCPLKEEQAA